MLLQEKIKSAIVLLLCYSSAQLLQPCRDVVDGSHMVV